MNLAIILLGVAGGIAVGAGLALQQRSAGRRVAELHSRGRSTGGVIESVVATGRQNTARRVTVLLAVAAAAVS